MNTIEIKEFEISEELGFAWIITQDCLTIQCCVDHNGNVDPEDNGMKCGICGDVNEYAFMIYGVEQCEKALMNEIKEAAE